MRICKLPNWSSDVLTYLRLGMYLSSCVGRMYPADSMLRERILGSMIVSSASSVFRMRPVKHKIRHICRISSISLWFTQKLLILSPNSPTTSSRTSFHSISCPDSCTMVTVTLLWMPCYVNVELFYVIT